jgi:hypothetical protein
VTSGGIDLPTSPAGFNSTALIGDKIGSKSNFSRQDKNDNFTSLAMKQIT